MKDLKQFIKTTIREFLNENTDSTFLSQLRKQDQDERNEYSKFVQTQYDGNYERGAEEYSKLKNRERDNVFGDKERINSFIRKEFNFDTFSEHDLENYWLLSQHADFDINFQKVALKNIKKYLGINNDYYKYLFDRISCNVNGKQKYGTQDICEKR